MKKLVKIISLLIVLAMLLTTFAACKVEETDDPADPTATADPAADDAEETSAFVGKVAGEPIYESEFYYFLYQGIREIYYQAEGVYDASLSEEENLTKMKEYFYSTADDGETYLQKAANRTLEIAQGFKIAYLLGKKAAETNEKYAITDEYIEQIISYIDSEADYGASVYGCTRDEYFFYAYGMNVNDAKRYTKAQLFAEAHETVWEDEAGYNFDLTEPTEPTKPTAPTDPGESATDEEKATYQSKLETYNTEMAEYEANVTKYKTELLEYTKAYNEYCEKFREVFEENAESYTVKTVRYLFLDKLGDDGELLSEEAIAEKMKTAEKCVNLVKNGDLAFEGVVKGFSESTTVSTDYGLSDIDVYNGDINVAEKVAKWAVEKKELSTEPEIVETDDAIFVVMLVGITDFDETKGITASSDITSEAVRESVIYSHKATLYNDYVEEYTNKDEYKVTDINNERMLALAKEYLEYTAE